MADISDTEPNIENSDSEDDEFIPKSSNKTINLNIDDSDKEDDDLIDDDNDDNDDISIAESEDSLVSNEEDDLGIEQINVQSSNLNDVEYEDYDSIDDEDDEDDDYNEKYLQKFGENMKNDTISEYYPELLHHNNEEVETLSRIVRNEQGIINDPLHRTFPFITKYERARILGERAKQLNMGAKPLVEVGQDVIDGYLIALTEYDLKRIPFIVKRPLPNGGSEYWKFKDLEII
jgi:DNA-directed RNA polymerases I, II, and III subunit RPABC2